MGKKMRKFSFLFKNSETITITGATPSSTTSTASPWPWPTCVNNPKTLSFRATNPNNIYKTMNSAYTLKSSHEEEQQQEDDDESFHNNYLSDTNSSHDEPSLLQLSELRSDRLFFKPEETSSILELTKQPYDFPYKETVAITPIDSTDPFVDFRVSMEEMVETHELKDWECLEELLACYLRVNGKSNHGYIVGAFIDLLMNLALSDHHSIVSNDHDESVNGECSSSGAGIDDQPCSSSSTATQYSFTSPLSFSSSTYSSTTSPCLSSMENDQDEIVEVKM